MEAAFAALHFPTESAAIGARVSVGQALAARRLHGGQATREGIPFAATPTTEEIEDRG